MISLKNVNKFYNHNGITNLGLRNINLDLNLNEIVVITGESGSGKSTLLNVITKQDTFDEGEIYYKGNETSYFNINDMDDFRKNKIGFIFQNYNIINSYTVLENVMLPLLLKNIDKEKAKEKALELIEKVGLKGKEKNRGTKLSGGEAQRCVIARALASDCEILACDEATGNLDSKTAKEIVELIKLVAKDKLVLIVTHNYDDFKDIATRTIKMKDGEILEDVILTNNTSTDEESLLDLDYVPLSKKVCMKVAKNNIIFTPKKSIFLMFIFLVANLIMLFLFQAIYEANVEVSYNNEYANQQYGRYYVYDKYNNKIDINKIKDNLGDYNAINTNTCYEDKSVYIRAALNGKDIFNLSFLVTPYYSDKTLYQTYDEFGSFDIIVPQHYVDNYLDGLTKDTLTISMHNTMFNTTIRNVYTTDDYLSYLIPGKDFELKLVNEYLKFNLKDDKVSLENKYDENINKLTLYLPKTYENKEVNLTMENLLLENTDYNIIYDDEKAYMVYYNLDVLPIYEASIYTDYNPLIKLSSLEIEVDDVRNVKIEGNEIVDFISNFTSYMMILTSLVLVVIMFFISYFILAKVYSSKACDYQILRTLGVTKIDMTKIVNYEVSLIGIFTSVLSFVIFIILLNTVPSLKTSKINFMIVLIYFIVSTIFTLNIAKRFNKKLFKFSVAKSLKDGI